MAFECSVFTHNCTYGGYELIVFVTSFDILSLEIIIPMVTLVSPEILSLSAKLENEIRGFVLSAVNLTRQYLTSQFLHSPTTATCTNY